MKESIDDQNEESLPPDRPPSRRKFPWAMLVVVGLFVVIPFLSWYGTWFGRPLSDSKIDEYLKDAEKPRNVQHALEQIVKRMTDRDPAAKRWYPAILGLTEHPTPQVRAVAAWAMGHDTSSGEFHSTLARLLNDENPAVRHNAALALVRFADDTGRKELVEMLTLKLVRAETGGRISVLLREGVAFAEGSPLARIEAGEGNTTEIRATEAGRIEGAAVEDGAEVAIGDELLVLSPTIEQVWEALRALYIVGKPEDIPVIQRYTTDLPGMPDRVRSQAALTSEAIRNRHR